jgi:L-asparaginase
MKRISTLLATFFFPLFSFSPYTLAQDSAAKPVVRIIATGGTIAMKIDPVKKAPVPAVSGEDLVGAIPELTKFAKIEVENFSNISSTYMGPDRWLPLQKTVQAALNRDEVAGVVIIHGTTTLEETAYFLDLTVQSSKPVVLTGALRNASEADFDGPRNILNAVRICVSPEAKDKGVMIALNNQINAAREATKTHTWSVETFKSGEFGFLGYTDYDRVIFYRSPTRRQTLPLVSGQLPYVEIVTIYAGASGNMVKAAVNAGAKGIIVQAFGWGNVNVAMYDAIKEAIGRGVPIVITSRVPNGRVEPVYGYAGGGKTLKDAGAVFGDDLSAPKARILLMLALHNSITDSTTIQKFFDR